MRYTLMMAFVMSFNAFAGTAFFTGRQQQVQTVTYRVVWQCEYNFNGQRFVRLFENFCPASVDVM